MNGEMDSESSRIEAENARLQMHIRSVKNEKERTEEMNKKLEADLNEQLRDLDRMDATMDNMHFDLRTKTFRGSDAQSSVTERKAALLRSKQTSGEI